MEYIEYRYDQCLRFLFHLARLSILYMTISQTFLPIPTGHKPLAHLKSPHPY